MGTCDTLFVLNEVELERDRQEQLFRAGKFPKRVCDPGSGNEYALRVLMEEVGECAKAINEQEPNARLREEVIQVAAVAVAWAEALSYD